MGIAPIQSSLLLLLLLITSPRTNPWSEEERLGEGGGRHGGATGDMRNSVPKDQPLEVKRRGWVGMVEPGGTYVAQWLESLEFKSEDPGFDPLVGQGEVKIRG